MAKYAGKAGVVYISPSGATEATSIVGLTGWTLNRTTDKFDVSEFGAANKTYVQGLSDVSGTLSGFWDDTSDQLYEGANSADGVVMYLYPSRNAVTKYFYGPAWVDFSTSTEVSGAISVSSSFSAKDAWGQM